MASTRFSSTLGRRSIIARIAALLGLVACGIAIYLLVMSFSESGEDSKNEKKGRSEQSKNGKQASATSYTVAAGDTLSAIAVETGVPEPKIERLNPDLDSETLNAGQILALR